MKTIKNTLLLAAISAILCLASAEQEPCSLCNLGNRVCNVEDGVATCGDCIEGYVEWRDEAELCVNIDGLDVNSYFEKYGTVYKENLTVAERLGLLKAAAEFISQFNLNSTNSSFKLGLNKYSADTDEEMLQRTGFIYANVSGTKFELEPYKFDDTENPMRRLDQENPIELPDKIDWVSAGAVTSVKDQGRCGCCWAVSMAGAVEGAVAANTSYLQSLSFQQYISCADEFNAACDGGNLFWSSWYTRFNELGGLSRLNDYKYTDYRGKATEECLLDDAETPLAVKISEPEVVLEFNSGPFNVIPFEERVKIFKRVLVHQPIAMVIKSACRTLSSYRSGVLTDDGDCACSVPDCTDHAILLVGYDDTHDPPYFKLKNSWGTGWGEDGYFRVAQTEKGPYGLFAMVSHGVAPRIAYNVTSQVEDEKQKAPLSILAITMITLASVFGAFAIGSLILQYARKSKEPASPPPADDDDEEFVDVREEIAADGNDDP